MKLSYLGKFSEDELKKAKQIGYDGLEASLRSWEPEIIDSPEKCREAGKEARGLLEKHGMVITALAFYGGRENSPAERIAIFKKLGEFAVELGTDVVATMAGGNPNVSLDENIPIFAETFSEVAKIYEDLGIKLAFENWHGMTWFKFPMKSMNIAFHPETLEMMFDAVPSPVIGIEYDPTHMVVQGIDHLWVLEKFLDRIHHMHLKDVEIDEKALSRGGMFKRDWFHWRIPGYGVIDWHKFIHVMKVLKYSGNAAVENEDDKLDFTEGVIMAHNTLRPLIPKPL